MNKKLGQFVLTFAGLAALGAATLYGASVANEALARPTVWNSEFHDPDDNLVRPSLSDAQVCVSYTAQVIETGQYDPALDEFCALRGLYLNDLADHVTGTVH